MKQILLSSLFVLTAASLSAGNAVVSPKFEKASGLVKHENVKGSLENAKTRLLAPGVSVNAAKGVKKLNAPALQSRVSKISPKMKKGVKFSAPEGFALYEDFEEWDGSSFDWIPDGWSVEMKGNVDRSESWTPSVSDFMLATSDGNYYYGVNYGSDQQDEWLISPSFKVEDGFQLSFISYIDPAFLFSLDNVDWNAYEFIGEKQVAATLQVWVQPEDEEWQMIHDFVDDYNNMTLIELLYATTYTFDPHSFDISDFAGKNVKIAFRYVGYDGNTMGIDAIGVGYGSLEDIYYMSPFSTLYWGFDRSWEMGMMGAGFAQYPVYDPIVWSNYSYADGATYSWTYCDPVTAEFVTSDEQDDLIVTYIPDYSSEATKRNNLFYPPVLTATAPKAAPGSYTAPYAYFQAGGKFEFVFNDGSDIEGGLLPFNVSELGLKRVSYDDPTIGDPAIPIFGYNEHSNDYWINYSLNGNEKNESDFNKLVGVANLIFPTAAPLVVNGVTMNAYGKVADDAEFTATIWALNEEMSSDYNTFTKVAEATITGADIIREDDHSRGYLCLPFDFETPAVLQSSAETPAYFVEVSGFNSEKVEYFAPFQSRNDDIMCLGYMHSYIDLSSHGVRDGAYHSFKPMQYKAGDDYVDLMGSFAIGLNAEYPWLTTDCEEVAVGSEPVEIALGSYYDGSQLTLEVPAGVEASVEGRYDECVLTVRHNNAEVIVDGIIKVKGPGVEVAIQAKDGPLSVDKLNVSDSQIIEMFDLNGRAVNASSAAPGIYITKLANGSVRKLIIK